MQIDVGDIMIVMKIDHIEKHYVIAVNFDIVVTFDSLDERVEFTENEIKIGLEIGTISVIISDDVRRALIEMGRK